MDISFVEKLESALKAQDKEKVTALMGEYFAQDLSEEEEGEVYALMLRLYMRLQSNINNELSGVLVEHITALKELVAAERTMQDAVDEGKARQALK
jgi:hypothetical protein